MNEIILYDKSGMYHCDNGPAVQWRNGDKSWYKHGARHRIDGPAIDWNDIKEWWVDGVLHRVDGPAVIGLCGKTEWWINGEKIKDPREFQRASGIAASEMVFIMLRYDFLGTSRNI